MKIKLDMILGLFHEGGKKSFRVSYLNQIFYLPTSSTNERNRELNFFTGYMKGIADGWVERKYLFNVS